MASIPQPLPPESSASLRELLALWPELEDHEKPAIERGELQGLVPAILQVALSLREIRELLVHIVVAVEIIALIPPDEEDPA